MKLNDLELAGLTGNAETPKRPGNSLAGFRLSWRWNPRQILRRLGFPGVVAIGLLTACAAFYISVMMPMNARIDAVHASLRSLSEGVGRVTGSSHEDVLSVGEQLAEFYRLFPQQQQLTDIVGKVFEIARAQGIALPQGEYRVSDDQGGRLRRLQITLPIKAEYPGIRSFLSRLATEVPTVALDHIQFERQKIGEPVVDATIKLVLYVERGS